MRKAFLLKKALCALCASVVILLFLLSVPLPASNQSPTNGINRPEHRNKPYLVLISLDGFRADYLDRFSLPTLQRLMKRGARARWMNPVFPTLTFPNHVSLVTGLHPSRHGIVGNSFYDPGRREKYAMSEGATALDGTWYRGEPIWVTAERQGMVAGCYFWPGSQAAIRGVRPTLAIPYDGKVPNDARVRTVLDWLQFPPEIRPHLITLYFSELDTASHDGPLDSPAIEQAARRLDDSLGVLLDGIDALPIGPQVNLLITSDHGMVETGIARTIPLETLTDLNGVEQTFDGPVTSLHLAGNDAARAARLRDQINSRLSQGRAYLRGELPERFQYRADPRAGDVVVVMNEGWTLRRSSSKPRRTEHWGNHGWDNALPSMRAVFVAIGPSIRRGVTVTSIDNVDVYPLMTELLGIRSATGIDGRPGRIGRLIRR